MTGSTSSHWLKDAQEWQAENLMDRKAEWYHPARPGKVPPKNLQCYNCGQAGNHFSWNCHLPRVNPARAPVYVAGVIKLSTSPLPPFSEEGKDSDE
jgi:hypothetical protein